MNDYQFATMGQWPIIIGLLLFFRTPRVDSTGYARYVEQELRVSGLAKIPPRCEALFFIRSNENKQARQQR